MPVPVPWPVLNIVGVVIESDDSGDGILDVGDGDIKDVTGCGFAAKHRVVEIAGVRAVDRNERRIAQILPARKHFAIDFGGHLIDSIDDGSRPFDGQPVASNSNVDLHTRCHVVTEYFDNFTDGPAPVVRLLLHPNHHKLSVFGPLTGLGYQYVLVDAAIVGGHDPDPAGAVITADNFSIGTLQHLDYVTVGTFPPIVAGDAHQHPVAVKDAAGFAMRQIDVRVIVVRPHKGETIGVAKNATGNEFHPFWETKPIAAGMHDLAVTGHRFQTAPQTDERRFFGDVEGGGYLAQIRRRRRGFEELG